MKELLNIENVERDGDLQGMRILYDDNESYVVPNVRSLDVDDDNYESLLTPIKKFETCDLTELLCLIQDEIKGSENCLTPDNSFARNLQDRYKVGKKFDSTCTGAGLHVSQQTPKIVCIFCQDKQSPDKCQVVKDPLSRREFLRKSDQFF